MADPAGDFEGGVLHFETMSRGSRAEGGGFAYFWILPVEGHRQAEFH